ncbi:hypothetical protein [Microbacterium sp. bgisy203]|uniref:hypothetical protein n=1 Tax=Microbacterium sp. bgisy203 TaxID=3413799 RepID=UPI003D74365E
MRQLTLRTPVIAAAAGALIVACVACSPDPAPTASPSSPMSTPSSSPTATPTPTPTQTLDGPPQPDAETAAACEQKIPLSTIQDLEGSPAWQQVQYDPKPLAEKVIGPAAKEAAASAVEILDCGWGVPNSDSGMTFTLADFSDQGARDALIAALDASEYEMTAVGAYNFYTNVEEGMGGTTGYAFDAKSNWYIVTGSMTEEHARDYLVSATQATNTF